MIATNVAPLSFAFALLLPPAAQVFSLPAIDPTIAYLLVSLGFLGILLETTHPGSMVPGILGGVSLAAGAAILLTFDNAWWAIGVLLAAEVATLASAHWVRHALLTAVGIAGFAAGSLLLLAAASIPALVVLASVAVVAVASFALAAAARRAHAWPVQAGPEVLVGRLAETRAPLDPQGYILVNGELWRARSVAGPIPRGATVRVLSVEGLTLLVTLDGLGQVEDLRDADRREAASARLERFGG